jgi:8-amino-7-oxononanoate synthase
VSDAWSSWWAERARQRAAAARVRRVVPTRGLGGGRIERDDATLISFAGSNYLGMARAPEIVEAVRAVVAREGMGERSAALITGHHPEHAALVSDVASLVGAEDGLIFASGWAANVGLLDALAGSDLEIFSDELNHASLIDGCRLARSRGAKASVYPHRDHAALEALLDASEAPRKLIVSDTVFSMEGAPIAALELAELARKHGAMLHLDEAHATLVQGGRGGGVAEGVSGPGLLRTVTLGKAIGSQGALVLGDGSLVEDLRQTVRSFVFSTALALPLVVAARAALDLYRRQPERRARLDALRERAADLFACPVPTPIVPITLGDEDAALSASKRLREAGFQVPAIRPPTVPAGTSRLRLVLSTEIEDRDLEAVAALLRQFDLI